MEQRIHLNLRARRPPLTPEQQVRLRLRTGVGRVDDAINLLRSQGLDDKRIKSEFGTDILEARHRELKRKGYSEDEIRTIVDSVDAILTFEPIQSAYVRLIVLWKRYWGLYGSVPKVPAGNKRISRRIFMGFFDFLSGKSLEERALAFNRDNGGIIPDFGKRMVAPRSPGLILAYFEKHPAWSQLPKDLLKELSIRVADYSRNWVVYDPLHALEVLVLTEYRSSALKKNFLPLCEDRSPLMDSPEAKLYFFSMTFSKLANSCAMAATESGSRGLSEDVIMDRLEDAKAFAEASLICDRYYIPSFMPAACGWALKDGDKDKALAILDEGIRWAREMSASRPHTMSMFDEGFVQGLDQHIHALEQTRGEIQRLE